jgi:hypothetical protein
MQHMISLLRLRDRAFSPSVPRPYQHVDHVLPPGIDQRGDGSTGDIFEAAAQQWIAFGGEIVHRRGVIELTIEPRFYRVLIRRLHVSQMSRHERANVTRQRGVGE